CGDKLQCCAAVHATRTIGVLGGLHGAWMRRQGILLEDDSHLWKIGCQLLHHWHCLLTVRALQVRKLHQRNDRDGWTEGYAICRFQAVPNLGIWVLSKRLHTAVDGEAAVGGEK